VDSEQQRKTGFMNKQLVHTLFSKPQHTNEPQFATSREKKNKNLSNLMR
jgi:hypothetical protein